MTLRAATPLDAGRIGQILSDWIDDTPWMPRIHTRAEDIGFAGVMIERGWVTVSEADSVNGFLARNGSEINALYIDKAARGQGLGARLIDEAKAQSDALGLWTFAANTGAQRFYKRLGFVETHRTDGAGNDERLPDIHFEWKRTQT